MLPAEEVESSASLPPAPVRTRGRGREPGSGTRCCGRSPVSIHTYTLDPSGSQVQGWILLVWSEFALAMCSEKCEKPLCLADPVD